MLAETTDTRSDSTLVADALGGDRGAFDVLVERYWRTAVALAAAKVGDSARAEDVAQESFIAAHARLATLRDPKRFAGWLSKIVAQRSIDSLRSARRDSAITISGGDEALQHALAPSGDGGLAPDEAEAVRAAVARLPERLRRAVVLRFVAGLPAAQIAEKLGKRPGTVRVWLYRAARLLRKDLAFLSTEGRK